MAKIFKKITKDVKAAGFDAHLYRGMDNTGDETVRLTPADLEYLKKELGNITEFGVNDINGLTGEVDLVAGEAIDLTVTGSTNTITISCEEATTTNLGVASFATADFNVTNGAVELKDTVVKSVPTSSGTATPSGHAVTIAAGEGIDTSGAGATVTIAGEDATTTNKGIASFATADFNVTSGAVELKDTVVKSVPTSSGTATPSGHAVTIAAGEGIDTSGAGATVTIAGEDATDTNKGIASFSADHFTVTTGAVVIKVDGIDDTLIDWGTGTNQVSAVDLPIADSGAYYTGTDVETALQEIGAGTTLDARYVEVAGDTMTGQLLFSGTGRMTVDLYITASGVKAPGGKPATFVEYGICGAWRFADQGVEANQESISGTLKLPTQMDKTVVPVFKVGWSANGVSPGSCEWQLEYLFRSPNEDTTGAAQETLTATGAASSTSDGLTITAFSGMDLPSATDQAMFFRITRLSAGGNDTIADDVEVRGMLFTHTRDKLGAAT